MSQRQVKQAIESEEIYGVFGLAAVKDKSPSWNARRTIPNKARPETILKTYCSICVTYGIGQIFHVC